MKTSSIDEEIKVLYIAGRGRSGSTIIDNILGQIDGFFSVGEIRVIRRAGILRNRRCGCGEPFHQCEVWREILENAFPGVDLAEISERLKNFPNKLHSPFFMLPGMSAYVGELFHHYSANCEKLYRSILNTVGCRVIVDSSKLPVYGRFLESIPSIRLYVVHLVRDPRAVVYSWYRKQSTNDRTQIDEPDHIPRENVAYSSLLWGLTNVMTEYYWANSPARYLLLRYEDFVSQPDDAIARIVSLVGENPSRSPFVDSHHVRLKPNHTVSGNPVRMRSGITEIRSNDRWREEMRVSQRKVVTALNIRLLHKYGYTV